tara:strand:- start:104 stop:487 length:384 start_codon:yes stop_codon:yes gene_type:complete
MSKKNEKILVDLTVQEDPLCGYLSYQIRLVNLGSKFMYYWVQSDAVEEIDRYDFAESDKELTADELRILLDKASWFNLDCFLDGSDFKSSKDLFAGPYSALHYESSIVKQEWLAQWIDVYLKKMWGE